jgi:sulfoquinovose isomerase
MDHHDIIGILSNHVPPRKVTVMHSPDLARKLRQNALAQLALFRSSLQPDGRLAVLGRDGRPRPDMPQELITTTRLVHSYALGELAGAPDCHDVIDAGMTALWQNHRDAAYGGFMWSFDENGHIDSDKLAYGHMFVLLAAASAKAAGHPDADRLLADVTDVIETRFWEPDAQLMADEFRRDWQIFSDYRGMNANMHGIEAHLSAYEITGDRHYLTRAQQILSFFIDRIGAHNGWRLPEHYRADWQVDRDYEGNPMFRPKGTTPGHSFELGRLLIQAWDLGGRKGDAPQQARALIETALRDAWLPETGFAYTLNFDGSIRVRDRYWWPLTEAIGAVATLQKLDPQPEDQAWYDRLWQTAFDLFIDSDGGWIAEIDAQGAPAERQFIGKPDIYHALQADLYPLHAGVSGHYAGIKDVLRA